MSFRVPVAIADLVAEDAATARKDLSTIARRIFANHYKGDPRLAKRRREVRSRVQETTQSTVASGATA